MVIEYKKEDTFGVNPQEGHRSPRGSLVRSGNTTEYDRVVLHKTHIRAALGLSQQAEQLSVKLSEQDIDRLLDQLFQERDTVSIVVERIYCYES